MMSLSGLLLHATVLAACCTGQSPDDARLPAPGMAGCWRFDRKGAPNAEGAARDHSPHGHHATLRPGAVTGSNGKIGGALVLDGKGGSAECPDAPALNLERQLTVMSWFRLEKGTLESQKILVGKGATRHADPYYQYAIAATDRDDVPATLPFHRLDQIYRGITVFTVVLHVEPHGIVDMQYQALDTEKSTVKVFERKFFCHRTHFSAWAHLGGAAAKSVK